MRSTVFNFFLLFNCYFLFAQNKVSGNVRFEDKINQSKVSVYDNGKRFLAETDEKGFYSFLTLKKELHLYFVSESGELVEKKISIEKGMTLEVVFTPKIQVLSEVVLNAKKTKVFELKRLKDVEGTTINAGRKTEVVLVEQSMANLASNNSRQIYSQVSGLNIYENDDAGIQLHIGGRGLDPNRTSNFNTRQNGYDISPDVLGYPESYYTPPAEALKEIQIIRGASSLQYGTQFGGLINFVIKSPNPTKPLELISRNTIGSNNLFTNFTSLSGTKGKFSYYTFFNFKQGDGFRDNSEFNSKNMFLYLGYQLTDKTSISTEFTYLNYLAQQAGGLSDDMFSKDPLQSNRSRNWFGLDWFLYNLKLKSKLGDHTNFSFSFFGLNAKRNSLGYRSNRVSQIDPIAERDFISGSFNNFGAEARLLTKYTFLNLNSTLLVGSKFYKSNNSGEQGPGSNDSDANFSYAYSEYPNYSNQSKYTYPNLNYSVFTENIFYLNDKISLTPGIRFEFIQTESDGFYKKINVDAAGNVILNESITDQEIRKRSFVLFGVGASYKPFNAIEVYFNASENYRSVTFADISIFNPAYSISPNISDESGSTIDLGVRGDISQLISYDVNVFNLNYNNRIGFIQKADAFGRVKSERGNVGDAAIYGIESLLDIDLRRVFLMPDSFSLNTFVNTSFITSKYTASQVPGIRGKKIEFVPKKNLKTGVRFGYNNLMLNFQYTYLSSQFTDASNATVGNLSGVVGEIPAYSVMDLSLSYSYKKIKGECGINNLQDNHYFTRRATGYPGPGIIPSAPRTVYFTVQIKL
jgi:Fe(3+) dicitrate transport protein